MFVGIALGTPEVGGGAGRVKGHPCDQSLAALVVVAPITGHVRERLGIKKTDAMLNMSSKVSMLWPGSLLQIPSDISGGIQDSLLNESTFIFAKRDA